MLGSSSVQFDIRVPWGSKASWAMQMWNLDGFTPFPVGSHTFEYVVRTTPTDVGTPVIRLRSDAPGTPTPAGGGLLSTTIVPTMAQVNLLIYPPATSALAPPLTYYHGLWMDYADAVNATNLWWGQFMVDPAVQT
jgi:hypothetical protein